MEPEAPPHVWLVFEPIAVPKDAANQGKNPLGRWTPLCQADNAKLETALAMGAKHTALIPVEGGRYDVDLAKRRIKAVYWDEPERQVIRSLWFKQPSAGDMVPYAEEDSIELEKGLQRLRARKAQAPLLVPVEKGRHDVRFELKPKEEPSGFASWFGGAAEEPEPQYIVVQESVDRGASKNAMPVFRWYYSCPNTEEPVGEEESMLPERVECLVLVVHGIGQFHKWHGDTAPAFHKDVSKVRANAVRRLLERRRIDLPVPGRLEFLPLEWFESVHVEAAIGDRLRRITLPSVASVREFANFAIADFMVYQDEEWKARLHSDLRGKIANVYETFVKRNADFSGQVAVVGHSLGSVIMFDLIQQQLAEHPGGFLADSSVHHVPPLQTPPCPVPRVFFGMGSPLGMFLSIRMSKRGQKVHQYFRGVDVRWPVSLAGNGWRFFNVFHPGDPIAYRIEPLLNERYQEIGPRLVPYSGGLRMPYAFGQWWNGTAKEKTNANDDDAPTPAVLRVPLDVEAVAPSKGPSKEDVSVVPSPSSVGTVSMDRMDYSLQESIVESMSEMVTAISSHFCYWESEDFASFVVDQTIDALAATRADEAATVRRLSSAK